ncbi:MAG: tetratricopeptide repeat protein [Nitrospirae bacterium]|nr:tetratricopeptide repeat protein [Nitrospirota bacterium]
MAATVPPKGSLSPEIVKLELKLAKDPRSKLFIPLAEEYVKAGMLQEAMGVLEEGLKVYPAFITALVALGRVYHQMGLWPDAKEKLEEAVKLSPDNLLAHRTLAQIYVEQGDFNSARRSCSVMLTANPEDEEALALKSVIDKKSGGGATASTGGIHDANPVPQTSPSQENKVSKKVARLREVLANIRLRRAS